MPAVNPRPADRGAAPAALRVGFAGTPAFAATALAALLEAGYTIPCVLTQPDRPKGRGMQLAASPVKVLGTAHGIAVLQPATLKAADARAPLLDIALDVLVVAAYGLILPPEILAWPRHGCLNIHASLLPRWRGAAPIARAIEAGDAASGITIMQMDAGLDTGAMLETRALPIAPDDTAGSLHDKLAPLGAQALLAVLARLARDGVLHARPQPTEGVTYAKKIDRDEARIDWTLPAAVIARRVRAFDPVPAAWTTLAGDPLKVWRARLQEGVSGSPAPGTVLSAGADGIAVACGSAALCIETLQPAGSRRMDAGAFVAGRTLAVGSMLGA